MSNSVKWKFREDDYDFNKKHDLYPGRRFIHITMLLHLSDNKKLKTILLPLQFETVMLDDLCYRQYTQKQRQLIRGQYEEFCKQIRKERVQRQLVERTDQGCFLMQLLKEEIGKFRQFNSHLLSRATEPFLRLIFSEELLPVRQSQQYLLY